MATIASLNIALTADSAQLNRALSEAEARSQRYARRSRNAYNSIATSIARLNAAFAAFTGLIAGGALIRAGDEITGINNLLRASGISAERLEESFRLIQNVAIATRSDLEGTARLFAVLTRNSEALGVSQEEILTVTRTIQQAFALAGASAAEAAGATRQLSQALASGVLRGEELNSVMENAPRIAEAIADQLGVSLGELRELAAEGRLTSNVVFQALLRSATEMNAAFGESNATFGQLATVFRTRILPALAQIGNTILPAVATALDVAAAAVEVLERNFRVITVLVGGALFAAFQVFAVRGVGAVSRAFGSLIPSITRTQVLLMGYGISALGASRAGNIFGRAIFLTTSRLVGASVAARTATAAARGLTIATRALGAAFRFLFGPIGLIVLAFEGLIYVLVNGVQQTLIDVGNLFIDVINFISTAINNTFGASIPIMERFQTTVQETADTLTEIGEAGVLEGLGELPPLLEEATTEMSAFERTLESAMDTTARLSEAGANAFNGISDALTDLVTTGMADFAGLARAIIRDLIRIAIQAAITRAITGSVFGPGGGVGSFLGSIFGGISGRQFGGPVNAGRPYVVGEAGPELFVPTAAGSVIPNDQFTQASSVGDVTIVNQIGPNVSARQVGDSVGSIFMDLINNTSLDQGAGVVSRVREAV